MATVLVFWIDSLYKRNGEFIYAGTLFVDLAIVVGITDILQC